MKKRRKNQSQSVFNEESLHFRLCHGCWHLNESSSEVTQCERCLRAFPSQFSQELFFAHERGEGTVFGAGLSEGNGMSEEDEDPFTDDDDETLTDSAEFRHAYFGLTGLSVRW